MKGELCLMVKHADRNFGWETIEHYDVEFDSMDELITSLMNDYGYDRKRLPELYPDAVGYEFDYHEWDEQTQDYDDYSPLLTVYFVRQWDN